MGTRTASLNSLNQSVGESVEEGGGEGVEDGVVLHAENRIRTIAQSRKISIKRFIWRLQAARRERGRKILPVFLEKEKHFIGNSLKGGVIVKKRAGNRPQGGE
ncbi:MAG: hypothetical protein LBT93_01000 [Treponema sp.]|jgi:hypothetical protein|nr:hypothetical protein [Treponema sp.]